MRYLPLILGVLACGPPHSAPIEVAATPVEIGPPDYDRHDWGSWEDADGDCQDTRQEVLIQESLLPVTFADDKSCKVASGEWHDPYSGETFVDPSKLDIDHVVPLKAAHDAGGFAWSSERKAEYSNYLSDPLHLIAVSASQNRSKGSKSPVEWLPENEAFHCGYVKAWISIKLRWGLEFSPDESRGLLRLVTVKCPSKDL